jgi:polypeptide N-acetylgalactosaminyltransferase
LNRVAAVWMDDYAKIYYLQAGNVGPIKEIGDISSRVKLRKDLQCASFEWYLKNVYPELDVPNNYAEGFVTNEALPNNTCLDSSVIDAQPVGDISFFGCHGQGNFSFVHFVTSLKNYFLGKGGTQYFELTKRNEIRRQSHCLDATGEVKLYRCHGGNQEWLLNAKTQQLTHKNLKKCLSVDVAKKSLIIEDCDENKVNQRWNFQYMYLDKFNKILQ